MQVIQNIKTIQVQNYADLVFYSEQKSAQNNHMVVMQLLLKKKEK